MSKFSLEIRSNKAVCVELNCHECSNKFSTALDLDFKSQLFQSDDILYCKYCEEPYKYTLKCDNHVLEVIFNNDDLFGGLKFSDRIYLEEFKTVTPKDSKKFYFLQIERLEKIMSLRSNEYIVDQALNRLVYSGVITSLETYLSEIFSQIVFYSEYTLEQFITEYEPYKKEKMFLHDIFKRYNSLELKVKDDLDNFIYHNVSKLINIFNIYNFDLQKFKKIREIGNYIQKRHNLVHRSGVDRNDNFQEVPDTEVIFMIKDINSFVIYIDEKIEKKCFLPFYDDDLPF